MALSTTRFNAHWLHCSDRHPNSFFIALIGLDAPFGQEHGAEFERTFSEFHINRFIRTVRNLGMGGAVNIQTSRLLGEENHSELRSFLGAARSLFLIMALAAASLFFVFSPWLPSWLNWKSEPGFGSLSMLFVVGGISAGLVVINSYIANLNYACGDLTLTVIPAFLLTQLALFCHWLLARAQFPIWTQYLPYVLASAIGVLLGWYYVRLSHPLLAELRIIFDRKRTSLLLGKSIWVYCYSAGAGITAAIDSNLITAGFGLQKSRLIFTTTNFASWRFSFP